MYPSPSNPNHHRPTILIVEDERHIAEGLRFNLMKEGFQTILGETGLEGLEQWTQKRPQLIILDIMLPQMDGLELLRRIRIQDKQTPILILSAKGLPQERIKGLQLGADDYLNKPFELEELILRVKKLLERLQFSSTQTADIAFDEIYYLGMSIIDGKNRTITHKQQTFILTEQDWKLLQLFLQHPNTSLERDWLLQKAWGHQPGVPSRTLDNFIVRLRKYIEDDPKNPQYFLSMRGLGYRLSLSAKELATWKGIRPHLSYPDQTNS